MHHSPCPGVCAPFATKPLFLVAFVLAGCAPSAPIDGQPGSGGSGPGGAAVFGSGGTTGTGGITGSGGTTATGGVSGTGSSVGSSGGTGIGAASGSGGVTQGSGGSGTGGAGTSGAPGTGGTSMTGGNGGTSAGGRGGTTITGGRGGASSSGGAGGAGGTSTPGTAPPNPSAGCGKANPQVGSSGSPLMISSHQYYVKLPTSYDPNKPYLVLFMFNPTGNPLSWAEQNAGFESIGAKDAAIRVYPAPLSMANGWGASDVSFFKPLYDQIVATYCVDKARVFAAGESSGGDFSSILGCEHANLLRGVGPCATKNVSAYPLNATTRKCTGQVTPVVIHGKNDNVVGVANGPATRDFYLALNHCGTTTQPVAGYTDALSNCVQYQGCDSGYPVYWCQHTDPNYSGTNHGWPAFAAKMLWSLFSSY